MTSLLLCKEQLKGFYSRHSHVVQFLFKFLFALCTFFSLNENIGYMEKLNSSLLTVVASAFCSILPWGITVFLAGCLAVAHIYTVSLEMALIFMVLMIVVGILYFGFKPGDSFLIVLTPLAFLFKIPYAVPLLVGLGCGLASIIPVSCGVFLYYLIMYVKQNAGVLTSEASVDMVQRYTQIIKSVLFNQTMMVMIATFAVAIVVVYMFRRLSMDYSWAVAIVAGLVAELLMLFIGDFMFGVTVSAGQLILSMFLSAIIAFIYDFLFFSVDYTRTEYVQFEDDDYYYYVKAVPKMTVSTTDVKVKKISTRKRPPRERSTNG